MNVTTPWVRNCEAAEELEELFEQIIARGMPRPDEVALMRQRLRRNTQYQVEAQHVIALTTSYLRGGEPARRNTESQTRRKERQLLELDGLDDDVA